MGSILEYVDMSFRWDELSTELRIAGYGHNEEIITGLINQKSVIENIGYIDEIINDIRQYIPEKKLVLKTSFNHNKLITESEMICKSANKETLKINIGYWGKTAVHYCGKVAFPSRGTNETVMGPSALRVPVAELTYEILKDIGVFDGAYINTNKIIDLASKIEEKIKSEISSEE